MISLRSSSAIGLQTELLRFQELGYDRAANRVTQGVQLDGKLRQALACPAHGGHRIPPRIWLNEPIQGLQKLWIFRNRRLAATLFTLDSAWFQV